ncbi:hypothetical protein [Pseudomonas graminis]
MPNKTFKGLSEDEDWVWLDFGIKISHVPDIQMDTQEQALYRFFFESNVVWKVDHVDGHGQLWLCVQHDEHRYQLLNPVARTYQKVPCDPPYPVPRRP